MDTTRLPEFGSLALPLAADVERPDVVIDADCSDVALVNPSGEFSADSEPALARLLAAAPDLLLALEAVVALTGDEAADVQDAAFARAEAAIAKARGGAAPTLDRAAVDAASLAAAAKRFPVVPQVPATVQGLRYALEPSPVGDRALAVIAALKNGDTGAAEALAAAWLTDARARDVWPPTRDEQRAIERATDAVGDGEEAWTDAITALVHLRDEDIDTQEAR